jgi:hypothetical protein
MSSPASSIIDRIISVKHQQQVTPDHHPAGLADIQVSQFQSECWGSLIQLSSLESYQLAVPREDINFYIWVFNAEISANFCLADIQPKPPSTLDTASKSRLKTVHPVTSLVTPTAGPPVVSATVSPSTLFSPCYISLAYLVERHSELSITLLSRLDVTLFSFLRFLSEFVMIRWLS